MQTITEPTEKTYQAGLIPQDKALFLILSGKAIITVVSHKTNMRRTFKIEKAVKKQGYYWVSYLRGADNDSDYQYLGYIVEDTDKFIYSHSEKSQASFKSDTNKMFDFLFNVILRGSKIYDTLEIWHQGKCCRCGRRLTTPESIARGLGPECAK